MGILAPSSSGADLDSSGLPLAEERLSSLGLGIRYGKHLWERGVLPALTPEQRLEDFVMLLEDREVSVIMAVYGGYNCIDLLPLLPYDAILRARKVIVGFSDITALLLGIYARTGLPGLHGPNFATLCEPTLRPVVLKSLRLGLTPGGRVRLSDPGEIADDAWHTAADQSSRTYRPHVWRCFRPGQARGRLLGGNLSTILALAGTRYLPDMRGAILLLEESLSTSPGLVDRNLAQLTEMGVLHDAAAILVGSFGRGSRSWLPTLLHKHFTRVQVPMMYDLNLSHCDPLLTIPLGGTVEIDAAEGEITYEPVVQAVQRG